MALAQDISFYDLARLIPLSRGRLRDPFHDLADMAYCLDRPGIFLDGARRIPHDREAPAAAWMMETTL